MKVEMDKEILLKSTKEIKTHNCSEHGNFSEILEKEIINNIEKSKLANTEVETTSIFAEKKVGKLRNDIFDTLIDI